MSSPYASAARAPAVPPTKEFTAAWIAYFLYAVSTVLLFPALFALVISYSKRGHPESGFIDSHHRWMLRSFWYSQIAFLAFFVLVMIGIWPLVMEIVHQALRAAEAGIEPSFNFPDFEPLFSSIGHATIGLVGAGLTWLWFLYRMVRGMITLADARPMP